MHATKEGGLTGKFVAVEVSGMKPKDVAVLRDIIAGPAVPGQGTKIAETEGPIAVPIPLDNPGFLFALINLSELEGVTVQVCENRVQA